MRGDDEGMKKRNIVITDVGLILLVTVFIVLPIVLFLNWIVRNDELIMLIKILTILISVFFITVLYRAIRCFFLVKSEKTKINLVGYIVVQSVSLIITLIIIGIIVASIQLI